MEAGKASLAGEQSTPKAEVPVAESKPKSAEHVSDADDAADPDEDDLDDLDDMLEEFSSVKLNSKTTAPKPAAAATAPSAALPSATPAAGETSQAGASVPESEEFSEEEFQKQLQAGMAELMGDLDGSPDLQAQFESIFQGLADTSTEDSPSDPASIHKSAEAMAAELSQDASFQETIKRTMARMQASGEQATAAAAAEGSEDDFIAEMLKAMKDGAGGEGSEEDFSKLLVGMMEQLTNKEILYEPMKELHDKFPGWMEKNKDKISKDDLKRYQEQQVLVSEMVAKFEEPTYSDSNSADREYIVDRMQSMQAAGSPPHDLVGDMPSAKEVLDAPEDSCAPQ